MSAVHRDIVRLKLQKRLIEERLNATDHKIDRLGEILKKKSTVKGPAPSPDTLQMTSYGVTVADVRMPKNKIKATPIDKIYDPYATEASPVTNDNILRIRQQHCIRTEGVTLVRNKIREKEERERRMQKKEPKYPKIPIPESMLPNRYQRGELPCTIEHGANGKYLSWACPLDHLDYEYYLPLFFDGLQVKDPIPSFLARQGIEDMLFASKGHPERIKPVVPLLARPLRNALSKYDTDILLGVLKALQQLVTCNEGVGEVLMKYAKQFLSPISLFMHMNKNIGDAIDYGQRLNNDVGEEIRKVLELMEEFGGPYALKHIKFSIPLCKCSVIIIIIIIKNSAFTLLFIAIFVTSASPSSFTCTWNI